MPEFHLPPWRGGRRPLFAAVIPFLILEICSVQAVELFVAPDGSDSNPGTREAPLATPAAARDALRERRARKERTPGRPSST